MGWLFRISANSCDDRVGVDVRIKFNIHSGHPGLIMHINERYRGSGHLTDVGLS